MGREEIPSIRNRLEPVGSWAPALASACSPSRVCGNGGLMSRWLRARPHHTQELGLPVYT